MILGVGQWDTNLDTVIVGSKIVGQYDSWTVRQWDTKTAKQYDSKLALNSGTAAV